MLQEQCSGRTPLHLAVDLQNPALVQQLVSLGADVNSLTYGGHVPYHLTFGRHDAEIRRQLYQHTATELRDLPESEYGSESEEEMMSEDECVSIISSLCYHHRHDNWLDFRSDLILELSWQLDCLPLSIGK